VPSAGLTDTQGAGVHFDRASLIQLGQRYAAAYDELEAKSPQKASIPAKYQLLWQDEFAGDKLDPSKWGFPSYKEREAALVNTEGTVIVSDGTLKLRAFHRGDKLHAAIIESRGKFQRRYGWFEARMKMHRLQGLHSCFWLQTPTFHKFPDDPAKSGTEMDIMEWFGAGRRSGWAGMNVYYRGSEKNVRSRSIPNFALMGGPDEAHAGLPLADMSETFHVYAAHWTPDACAFYCDGIEILRDTQAVSQVDEYIVFSLLSSNWERPRLKLESLPDELIVDYVRVYGEPALPNAP
jgi:beta-glucanase (GH16 family)